MYKKNSYLCKQDKLYVSIKLNVQLLVFIVTKLFNLCSLPIVSHSGIPTCFCF